MLARAMEESRQSAASQPAAPDAFAPVPPADPFAAPPSPTLPPRPPAADPFAAPPAPPARPSAADPFAAPPATPASAADPFAAPPSPTLPPRPVISDFSLSSRLSGLGFVSQREALRRLHRDMLDNRICVDTIPGLKKTRSKLQRPAVPADPFAPPPVARRPAAPAAPAAPAFQAAAVPPPVQSGCWGAGWSEAPAPTPAPARQKSDNSLPDWMIGF